MSRYLLDSNGVTAFIDHREPLASHVRAARRSGDRIAACEPVVAELFYGLEFSPGREEHRRASDRRIKYDLPPSVGQNPPASGRHTR
jgi:predicted nucleic acid-binding protein